MESQNGKKLTTKTKELETGKNAMFAITREVNRLNFTVFFISVTYLGKGEFLKNLATKEIGWVRLTK